MKKKKSEDAITVNLFGIFFEAKNNQPNHTTHA